MAHEPPKTKRLALDTPRTDKAVLKVPGIAGDYEVVFASFAQELETHLNEARALLTRISDGAEPVLIAEEIEEFLDKTELP
jgi:hypothetical protein